MKLIVKFISNNDGIRMSLPFGSCEMKVLPEIGHKVKIGSSCTGKITEITHVIGCLHDVEIYLSAP